jgi:hypothetical protein
MKVALAFWGLTRSLKHTYPTIQRHIFDVLKKHAIDYTVFLHTYYLTTPYTNPRSKEFNLTLDNEEYTRLQAHYVQREDQDAVKQQLNLSQYRTHPDPWNSNYTMVDNFVLAMYSKQQLGQLIESSGESFDYVLFLRPDVQYVNDLNPAWFQQTTDTQLCVPDFHCFSFKFNDRFALATQQNALKYSKLFREMLPYSQHHPLHSETMNYWYVSTKLNLTVAYIPFYFNRVRANGQVSMDVPQHKATQQ